MVPTRHTQRGDVLMGMGSPQTHDSDEPEVHAPVLGRDYVISLVTDVGGPDICIRTQVLGDSEKGRQLQPHSPVLHPVAQICR